MTTTSATPSGHSSAGSSSIEVFDRGQADAGPFMLTLCYFEGPVSIRPPQSPQLKRFTFFTTSIRHDDRSEHVYLHMGYFETLADAERLLSVVRRRFPGAIAARAPAALLQPDPSALVQESTQPPARATAGRGFAPVGDESLTDTQVMKALETRGIAAEQNNVGQPRSADVEMLRPEDTSIRRALKEAVVQGAPVFFAVQLEWSAQPIDPGRVPPLAIFKTHTLYAMESRREGRCRYFLRVGFFADAASAKETAFSVRSRFASAVVVPVTEQEFTCARAASTDTFGLAHVCLPIYETSDKTGTASPTPESNPAVGRRRRSPEKTETLEQTLETLAAREMWNDPDSTNDSGVRHLKFQVLERRSRGS